MQPLSYQISEATCLPISIINGIMFLLDGERISNLQYNLFHSAINSILSRHGVVYYTDNDFYDYRKILDTLEAQFPLRFRCVQGERVDHEVRDLHFNRQVAVCNVGNGEHSILLNGISKCGEWLSAFDPWWYTIVENDRTDNENVRFSGRTDVANVPIRLQHLLNCPLSRHEDEYGAGRAYPIGNNKRRKFVTILERT